MTDSKTSSEKELSLYINNLLSLSSSCLSSIEIFNKTKSDLEASAAEKDSDSDEETPSPKNEGLNNIINYCDDKLKDMTRSIKDYRACLTKIRDNASSHAKFFKANKDTYDKFGSNLRAAIFQKVDDKERLMDKWVHPSDDNDSDANGYRNLVLYISKAKKPSYSVPVSECYRIALMLCSEVDIKYKYIPARILFFLFSAMASMEEEFMPEDELINEIAVNADRFKDMASISLEDQTFDFDGLTKSLTSMVGKVEGGDNKVAEILGEIMGSGGDMGAVMSKYMDVFQNISGGKIDEVIKNLTGLLGSSKSNDSSISANEQD